MVVVVVVTCFGGGAEGGDSGVVSVILTIVIFNVCTFFKLLLLRGILLRYSDIGVQCCQISKRQKVKSHQHTFSCCHLYPLDTKTNTFKRSIRLNFRFT